MDQTQNKKNDANRTALLFVVKLLFFYILLSQGNRFFNSVMSSGGRFYNEYIAGHFNYLQGLKTALIVPAVWIIKLFGFYAIHNASDVLVVDGPHLRVNYSCLGIGVMSFLFAFALAFPAEIKSKVKLVVFGILLIYVLNVLRIAGLSLLLARFNSQQGNFNYHHEIFNLFVYIIIFMVLYYWMKKNTNPLVELNNTKID